MTFFNYQKKNRILKNTLLNLRKKINYNKSSKKNKLVIISRSKSRRKLINEHELYKSLKKYGFKSYCFEDLSISEQINLCNDSKLLIGYQGSGLINSIYMQKGSVLIDITNKYIDNYIYPILTSQLGIKYYNSKCSKSYKNLDGICNVVEIEKIVKKIIC